MGKKQKKMLARILVSAVLFAAGFFLPLAGWSQLVFYLAVYAISLTGRYLMKIF